MYNLRLGESIVPTSEAMCQVKWLNLSFFLCLFPYLGNNTYDDAEDDDVMPIVTMSTRIPIPVENFQDVDIIEIHIRQGKPQQLEVVLYPRFRYFRFIIIFIFYRYCNA